MDVSSSTKTRACTACGENVSLASRKCVHCGHPLKNSRGIVRGLIVMGLFAAGAIYLLNVINSIGVLPSCDSASAQDNAKRVWENGPGAKRLNVTIVSMSGAQTLSSSDAKVECKARVILNSSAEAMMDYSFSKDASLPAGQYLVRSILDTTTLHPYR
jgi:hypothetical protein